MTASITELEEDHSGEDDVFSGSDKINQAEVNARLKEIKGDPDAEDERKVLSAWLRLTKSEAELKKQIKAFDVALDAQALAQYPQLTTAAAESFLNDFELSREITLEDWHRRPLFKRFMQRLWGWLDRVAVNLLDRRR